MRIEKQKADFGMSNTEMILSSNPQSAFRNPQF